MLLKRSARVFAALAVGLACACAQAAGEKVFSRAAIMAAGVDQDGNSKILTENGGRDQGRRVSERIAALRKAGVIRPQVVNPDGEAQPGEYPWMAAFEVWDALRNDWVQYCSGTVVAKKLVLSAVHCNNFPPELVRIVIQAVVLDHASQTQYYHVRGVEKHPQFAVVPLKLANGRTLDGLVYDLALYVLDRDPGVTPVALTGAKSKSAVLALKTGRALGWGVTGAGRAAPALVYLDVPIVDDAVCGKSYSPLQPAMLCAGLERGGKDTCQGDSGGPLLVLGKSGKAEQAAVVSFGEGCGTPEFYGIYSSLPEGRDWVLSRLAIPR